MLRQVRDEAGPWKYVVDNGRLTPAQTARAIYSAVSQDRGLIQS